jgi:hypothetical protein
LSAVLKGSFTAPLRTARSRGTRIILFVLIALIACLVMCRRAFGDVVVFHPDTSDANAIAVELVRKIPASTSLALAQAKAIAPSSTLIALGPAALQAVPSNFKGKIVATFVSPAEYSKFRQSNPDSASTALFTTPSPTAQLRLAAALLNEPRVGLVYSNSTPKEILEQYEAAAKSVKLTLILRQADSGDVLNAVRRLLSTDRMDVLVILDETGLYPSEVLIPTLRLLLRYNRSAIAFGPGIVKAGAIGATYFDRAAIFASLLDITRQVEGTRDALPEPRYPDKAAIVINRQYLRSVYDLLFVDDANIEEAVNGH